MPGLIQIRNEICEELTRRARCEPLRECCGLLAGRDGVITHVYPAENVAADPARNYELAPKEIVRLLREFRAQGLEFLGIYHSHPNSDNKPSPRDIELAYYSEAAYFILSPRPDAANPVRVFTIRDGRATELEIQVVP